MSRLRLPFLLTVLLGAGVDLATKSWAFKTFSLHEEWHLVGRWLGFQLAYNRGAVWGLFQGQVDLLTIFSVAAVGFMLYLLYKEARPTVAFQIVLGLIVAGALGNLWDRLVYKQVRDFIVLWLGDYRWPTFNVADAYICVGVALFLLREMGSGATEKKDAVASS